MTSWLTRLLGGSTPARSVRFPFEVVKTATLGELRRPTVEVKIWSEVFQNWHKVPMLIDTGADYTLLPKYLGALFTVKPNGKNRRTTIGIGGNEEVYFIEKVRVKVGPFEREVPVGISSSNKVPPLMGRHLFFETFITQFTKNQTVTFSE